MNETVNPASYNEVLDKLTRLFSHSIKSSSVPFTIFTNDGRLGIPNGNYIGTVWFSAGNVTGIMINHWNPLLRIQISATLHTNPKQITIEQISN